MYINDIPLSSALTDLMPRKLKQLENKGFETVGDLVSFVPRKYEDRSRIVLNFGQLGMYVGQKVAVIGTVTYLNTNYVKDLLTATVADNHGQKMSVKWFHQNYLSQKIYKGRRYLFYGRVDFNPKYGFSINGPSMFSDQFGDATTPLAIYRKIPGMSAEYLQNCISRALVIGSTLEPYDPIPEFLRKALGIDEWKDYIQKAHKPQSMTDVHDVERRQTAELLLPFAMQLTERKYEAKSDTDKVVNEEKAREVLGMFKETLPFELTDDQTSTLESMIQTVSAGHILDTLVQGDVGCGKTVIAEAMAAVMASEGYQTAIMAPTTVLAEQHYEEFSNRFASMPVSVAFLSTKLKAKERRELLEQIRNGDVDIIVGTHAVISKDVEYKALGLTIVDEEHRFGVDQRKALREKTIAGAHNISMSATPIPRSLALALYGETTTVYNIHTMPKGRQPVETMICNNEEKVYEAVYRQIKAGHQAYVICPLIAASDAMEGIDSLRQTEEKMTKYFEKYPEVRIGCVNGKMKADEIHDVITDFADGKYHILLSTTIVEVGMNVPNATVMVVKNAERFGLAQLHQLRGRVGRSTFKSYCVLLSEDSSNPRLNAMVQTNDGFEIASIDLEQRGAGNLVGIEQSGFDRAVNAMVRYNEMYKTITREMEKVMEGKIRYEQTQKMMQKLNQNSQ